MPAFPFRFAPGRASAIALALLAFAASPSLAAAPPDPAPPVASSNLDAPLFYQLLLGEIELRSGDTATAYQLLLDAARRAGTKRCFVASPTSRCRRAPATRPWPPCSRGARRCPNRRRPCATRCSCWSRSIGSAKPTSRSARCCKQAPRPAAARDDRGGAAFSRPRHRSRRGRAADRAGAETLRRRSARREPRRCVASGRGWLAAGDTAKALDFAQRAAAASPNTDGPALLALELLPAQPAAEAIVTARIAVPPSSPGVRLLYVRTLAASQRIAEAPRRPAR